MCTRSITLGNDEELDGCIMISKKPLDNFINVKGGWEGWEGYENLANTPAIFYMHTQPSPSSADRTKLISKADTPNLLDIRLFDCRVY